MFINNLVTLLSHSCHINNLVLFLCKDIRTNFQRIIGTFSKDSRTKFLRIPGKFSKDFRKGEDRNSPLGA